MTTGLEYVLGKLKEIRDLAVDAPEAVSVDALSGVASMAAELLTAIEGPTTLARQIAERTLHHGSPEDAAAEIVGFIRDLEGGGVERLVHEALHGRRSPDPELEAAALRILEDIRATRRVVSDSLERGPVRWVTVSGSLEIAQAKLNGILRDIATSPDPGALRRKLAELTEILNVGGPISPEPYPGSVDDVAGEITAFVDELDFTDSARGLRKMVADRLADLERQRVEQERQTRIAVVLKSITDNHLRPALADLGITLSEGYVLEWRETGDVVPGE